MDAMRNVAVDPSLLYERVREHRKGVHYVHPSICAEIECVLDSISEAFIHRFLNISMAKTLIGAIDQGTSSTRFIIFDQNGRNVAQHQVEFPQIYPKAGQVYLNLL